MSILFITYVRTILEHGYAIRFYSDNLSFYVDITLLNDDENIKEKVNPTFLSAKTFFELESKLKYFIDNQLGGL